jgi:hypothetical protein
MKSKKYMPLVGRTKVSIPCTKKGTPFLGIPFHMKRTQVFMKTWVLFV